MKNNEQTKGFPCEKCGESFTLDLENTPYQVKEEQSQDLPMFELRTYRLACPHCGETNTITFPVLKSLKEFGEAAGHVKTINVKGGPACLLMLGIFTLLLVILGMVGYFLFKGIGTVFSWM